MERLERRERLETKLDVLGRAREWRERAVWDIRRTKRVQRWHFIENFTSD